MIYIFFFLIALVYSMAGFGGGSSYIAFMLFSGFPVKQVAPTALCCNIVVVCINIYKHKSFKLIKYKDYSYLVLLSIPAAFLGGVLKLENNVLLLLFSSLLLISGIKMLLSCFFTIQFEAKKITKVHGALVGMLIGFFSGLVGIGGGIFLSPILNLFKIEKPKQVAAICSYFILVNSCSGLAGQFLKTGSSLNGFAIVTLSLCVALGALLGGRVITNQKVSHKTVYFVTSLLILFVAIRLSYNLWLES